MGSRIGLIGASAAIIGDWGKLLMRVASVPVIDWRQKRGTVAMKITDISTVRRDCTKLLTTHNQDAIAIQRNSAV